MSQASQRGRQFELYIAKMIRRKLGIPAYRDSRSGGGDTFKGDIRIPAFEWNIEGKAQEKINIRSWWRQTNHSSPLYKQPLLVFDIDRTPVCVVKFDDFLNLIKELQDDNT